MSESLFRGAGPALRPPTPRLRRFLRALPAISVWLPLLCISVRGADAPSISRVSPPGAQRSASVELKLVGKPGDGPLKLWSDRSELSFVVSEKQDAAKVTVPETAAPGVHWIRFYNEHGSTEMIPFLVGVIPEIPEAEPNNEISKTQLLNQPSVLVNGVLEKTGDVDLFGLSVVSGETIVASMQANNILGSPMDGVLQILDSAGTVVAQNDDDHAMDPQIAYQARSDGLHHIRVFAFPSAPNSTIRMAGSADYVYRLTVTKEAFIDHVSPAVLDSSKENSVVLHGWNLGEQRTVALPPFDGPTGWVIGAFSNAYPVLSDGTSGSVENGTAPQTIVLEESVTGGISVGGEKDAYQFDGKKGQRLKVSAACRSLYSMLDPVLTVKDSAGKVLKESDDRSRQDLDAEAIIALKADGPCAITLTDRYGDGGDRYFYVLTVRESKPEFTATSAATSFTVLADKALEIPITIGRQNGFAEKVTIGFTELPPGLTCESVESAKDGETSKAVTLKVVREAGAAAFSGALTISCTDESGAVRQVTATIPKSPQKTSAIWLTVPPPPADPPK